MKTNEKVCKKCRDAYYKIWAPGGWGSALSRTEIVTKGCAQVLHNSVGSYEDRVQRWWDGEVAEDCPYILELTLLQEQK